MVWPEQFPEDVTVVTITPDYPSSRHTGLVSGLRKFTWYLGSTLCFTTPGDGPRSLPTLLQTHEDSEYKHTHTVWIKPAQHKEPLLWIIMEVYWLLCDLSSCFYQWDTQLCGPYLYTARSSCFLPGCYFLSSPFFVVSPPTAALHFFSNMSFKDHWFICFQACWYL